jgi:hypothetical protein
VPGVIALVGDEARNAFKQKVRHAARPAIQFQSFGLPSAKSKILISSKALPVRETKQRTHQKKMCFHLHVKENQNSISRYRDDLTLSRVINDLQKGIGYDVVWFSGSSGSALTK